MSLTMDVRRVAAPVVHSQSLSHNEPLSHDRDGQPVCLRDLWPTQADIDSISESLVKTEMFLHEYGRVLEGDDGDWTVHLPDGEGMTIYDAAHKYQAEAVRHGPAAAVSPGKPLTARARRDDGTERVLP